MLILSRRDRGIRFLQRQCNLAATWFHLKNIKMEISSSGCSPMAKTGAALPGCRMGHNSWRCFVFCNQIVFLDQNIQFEAQEVPLAVTP